MKKSIYYAGFLFICMIILTGCGKDNATETVADTSKKTRDEATQEDTANEIEKESEDKEKQQADSEVWIGGEVTVKDDTIIVEGESNLPEGLNIHSNGQTDVMAVGGLIDSAKIEEDGSFYFELPNSDSNLTINFKLQSSAKAEEFFGENLSSATGPFIYETEDSERYDVKATIRTDSLKETPYSIAIETPKWKERPADYGDPKVWMEVESVDTDHDYIYVNMNSNLIEGTWLGGNMENAEGGIIPFSFDHQHVHPDGTFQLKIPYQSLRAGMYLPIQVEAKNNSWDNVLEAYGENGEKWTGELVQTNEASEHFLQFDVELQAPELTAPEEVDLTVDEEEIKMQVPDHLLFDIEKSELKADAEETLNGIITDLEKLPENTTVHINGHTDNTGEEEFNKNLSIARADAAFEYLKENGEIDHLSIETKGYGETAPIASNEDEDGRNENRRVEIVINPKE